MDRVVVLARSLHGHESESAFPLQVLVEELEEVLFQLLAQDLPVDRLAVVHALMRVGLSCETLIQSYVSVLRKWESRKTEMQLQVVGAASSVLIEWVRKASRYLLLSHFSIIM
jgi:hypothetical protein